LANSVRIRSKKAVKKERKLKMSNLSNRVEKAKELNYSHNPHAPAHWSTWGSRDKHYGEKYYRVILSHAQEIVNTPDGEKQISVFMVDCQKDTGNGQPCNCPGNERHTVCYHGLGAIYRSFEQAKAKKLVSFFETYEAAKCMSFGGNVAKVKSANGSGFVWCVVKDWPTTKEKGNEYYLKHGITEEGENELRQEFKRTVDLMRGSADDEGID
jgi:hypothetical protein